MNNRLRSWTAAAGLLLSGAAAAQDGGLSVSAGLRLWQMQWMTFSYASPASGQVLTQAAARDRVVLIPALALRSGDWLASLSGFSSTRFDFVTSGGSGDRSEVDANIGWFFAPRAVVTLGYKRVSQRDGEFRYEPRGPVIGLSASAPLTGTWSLVGSFGVGWLKTQRSTDPRIVQFDAGYRLSEVGLNYALDAGTWWRALTLSAGWRVQTLSSRDALPRSGQDGRDLTEGLTLGVVARF